MVLALRFLSFSHAIKVIRSAWDKGNETGLFRSLKHLFSVLSAVA